MVLPLPLDLDRDFDYRVVVASSRTDTLRVYVLWTGTECPPIPLQIGTVTHSAGDRTVETFTFPTGGGTLYAMWLEGAGGHRGDTWAELQIGRRGSWVSVAKGYVHGSHGLDSGTFEDNVASRGFLDWNQDGNDVAGNTDTTVNLAATNARRLVRAILVKYHSSGTAASRTIILRLRDVADTSGPTGMSIDEDVWESPTLTLTANEEGIVYVTDHGFLSTNDAGTLAYADNTTAPNPFPLWVDEGDTVDLIVDVTNGQSNDDYDVFTQIEEWIEI